MDNERPHNSRLSQKRIRASKAEWLPHPAYGPDITPSDFFPFEYLKEGMSDYNCASGQTLLKTIAEFFCPINKVALTCVFKSWINWLQSVIKDAGATV
jgi:hypothetical protein